MLRGAAGFLDQPLKQRVLFSILDVFVSFTVGHEGLLVDVCAWIQTVDGCSFVSIVLLYLADAMPDIGLIPLRRNFILLAL